MDAKIKADWIAALRSGEWKQARGQLHKDGAYCCLGVLCEVAGIAHNDMDCLSDPVRGYGPLYVMLGGRDRVDTLTNKNDFERAPFAEIADWIEAHL